MTEAARAEKNAYKRKWRKENPEKVRAANERYWEKKARGMSDEELPGRNDNSCVVDESNN